MRRLRFLLLLVLASLVSVPLFGTLRVFAAPYALSASTTNVGIPAGSSSFVYVTATSGSFSGTLPLRTSISGVGVTASLDPASVVLSPGGSAVAKLSFTLPVGTGTGYITVIGDAGLGQATVDVMVTVGQPGPDFKVACCFSTGDGKILVTAGQTYTSWGWVYSLNNFTGTVNLGLNVPFPFSITPSETLTAGATAMPDLALSPPSTTVAGTYIGSLTGTSGSVTHTILLSVTVNPTPPPPQGVVCFSLTANSCPSSPVQFSAPMGSTFTAYVVIQGSQAFNGFNIWFGYPYEVLNATSLSLAGSALPGATLQFECINGNGSQGCGYWLGNGPGIVALYATGNQTTAPTTRPLYSVTFKVTGTGTGGLGFFCVTSPSGPWYGDCARVFNGSNNLSLNVQGASFTTGPGSGTGISVQQTVSFDHLTATISGSLAIDASARTLTGSISVTVVNSTSGQTIFTKAFTISMTFGSNSEFRFVLAIPITPLPLGVIFSVNPNTDQIRCFLARDPDMGSTGMVSIVDVVFVFQDFSAVQGSPAYRPAADLDGNGVVDIFDASVAGSTFSAPVFS